jgi:hypothetical protein
MKITKEELKRIIKEEILKEVSRGRRPIRYRRADAGDETASYGPDEEIYNAVRVDMSPEQLKTLISVLNKYSINFRDVREYQKQIIDALETDYKNQIPEKYRTTSRKTWKSEGKLNKMNYLIKLVKDDSNWKIDKSAGTI